MQLTYHLPYQEDTIDVLLEAFPLRESDYGYATEKYGIEIVSQHPIKEWLYITKWRDDNIVMLDELFCKETMKNKNQ